MAWLLVFVVLGMPFVYTQDYDVSWQDNWSGCTSYEFECDSSQCRFTLMYCESASVSECEDGIENSIDCSTQEITFDNWLICDVYEFPCGDDDCILSAVFCDGSNCIDSYDSTVEDAECYEVSCSFHQTACDYMEYGGCISNLRFCDGTSDCVDGLDEPENCSTVMYQNCESITTDSCQAVLPYEYAVYPNPQAYMQSDVATFVQSATSASFFDCSKDMSFFVCAMYSPYCSPDDSSIMFPPCRSLCERIQTQCLGTSFSNTFDVTNINCTMYPETDCTNYNSACGGNVTLSAGESFDVNHPNYPNSYDGDQYCAWYVYTSSENYLAILFANVDIDAADTLTFGEGTNPFDSTTGFLDVSGSSLPNNETTGLQGMWIQWDSARASSGGKWHVVVEALECGGYYVVDTGTTRTFSSPNIRGKDSADCEWHITAATSNKLMVVQFQNFSSSADDIIYVGEGLYYDTSSIAFNHSSNDTMPYDWTAEGHEIWVRWITSSLSDLTTGWRFSVEGVKCGGRYFVNPRWETRDFVSPNYPSDYDVNTECIWYIFTTDGDKLATHFSAFETEASLDVVTIGYGGDASDAGTEVASGSGLRAPQDYLFPSNKLWVKFTSNDKTVYGGFSLTVQFVSGLVVTTEEPPPTDYELAVSCLSNCDEVVSPDEALSAAAVCANCIKGEEYQYSWTLFYTASTLGIGDVTAVTISGDDFTSTGTSKPFIYINAGQLEPGRFYKLKANISDSGGGYGKASWGFVTNAPPSGGNCSVSPSSGYAIDTKFRVDCENWDDIHTPLRFAVSSQPKGSSLSSLIYVKADTSTTFMLPMGSKSFDYEVDITIEVQDSFLSKATEQHTVTVEPPSLTGDDLASSLQNLTSGENSMLGSLLSGGNKDAAVSLVVTVASVLNVGSSEGKSAEEVAAETNARKALRESILKDLSSISQSAGSVDEVSQMASAVVAMTSVPTELTEDSQVNSASSMEALSGSLFNMKNSSETSILSSASAISDGIGNVLASSMTSSTSGEQSSTAAASSSAIARSAVNSVNSVSKAVLSKRVPGLAPVVLNTSSVAIQLQRDAPSDIGGKSLTSSSGGNFKLPSADTLFGAGAANSFVDTQFTAFSGNPFNWDNTSADISSPIISLSFNDDTGNGVDVSGLSEPIELRLPISGELPEPELLNVSTVDPDVDLYYYTLQIPKAYTAIHFRIFPNESWHDVNYTIFFKPDDLPSKSSYNYSGTLPHLEYENDTSIDEYLREEYTNTFFVPSDQTPDPGVYYFAIYFESGTLNISVQIFTSGCRYWDEVEEVFKGDGCHVDNRSNSLETICQCTHLTSFGSDFVVPPNTIDFGEAFANFANLSDNASVFSTVVAVFGLYVLIAIWARREDKKDVEKWGITPLADNKPGDKYLYQISVYTGMRSGAGTRSKVFMILSGERNESEVRILSDKKRKVFQKGKISSFLMAVPSSLGDVSRVRIWHDNSGRGQNASWYLSKVVVQDLQTKEVTNFLCEKWLAVERGDTQIQRTLSPATDKELTTFKHQFSNNAKKDFTDGHIWFSIVSRPSHSSFTRVQRLSCCLSLLYTTMIASCMWYKSDETEDGTATTTTDHVLKIGPITFSLQAIMIGIMSSLVVFPVNVIVIQLFRKSRQKHAVTISSMIKKPNREKYKQQEVQLPDGNAGVGEKKAEGEFWAVRSKAVDESIGRLRLGENAAATESSDDSRLYSATERGSRMSSGRSRRNSCPSRSSAFATDGVDVVNEVCGDKRSLLGKAPATSETGRGDEPEPVPASVPLPSAIAQYRNLRARRQSCPAVSASTLIIEDLEVEDDVEEPTSKGGDSEEEEEEEKGDGVSQRGDEDAQTPSDEKEKEEVKKKKKKPFMFPYWCIYIGWVLVFLSSATSAFFTVLYSMQWGHEKSLEWLISFLVSFFESILVIQPVKVLCIAVLLAMIIKTPNLSDATGYDVQLGEDEEYLHDDDFDDEELIKYKPPPPPPQDPPSEEALENARLQRKKESEMCEIIRDITAYSFYLLFLLIIAYGNRDLIAFYYRKSLDDSLFQNNQFLNIENGFNSFYTWVNVVFLPALYPQTSYNGNNLTLPVMQFFSDMVSYRVGSPRFRQLRVQPGLCDVLNPVGGVVEDCITEYSFSVADNQSYFHGWSSVNNTGYSDDAWRYRSLSELEGVPIYGVRRMFGGDGYVAELGSSYSEAKSTVDYLLDARWLDRHTRAVFVEFSLYNPNINLFSMVTLLLEFPATGASLAFLKIDVLRLYSYVGSYALFYIASEVIFMLFVLYYVVIEILRMNKMGCRYFKSFWTWEEILKTTLSVAGIAIHFYKNIFLSRTLEEIGNDATAFLNLQRMTVWNELFGYILASVVFLSVIKFIYILRFNRRISLLSATLKESSSDLAAFSVQFVIFMLAFGQSFQLTLGSAMNDYRSFFSTMETLFSAWLGIFDYDLTTETNRIFGPLLFFTFTFFIYLVMTTIFVAMILKAFSLVKADNDKQKNEYELVDYLWGQLKGILGLDLFDEEEEEDDDDGYVEEEADDILDVVSRITSARPPRKDSIDILLEQVLAIESRLDPEYNSFLKKVWKGSMKSKVVHYYKEPDVDVMMNKFSAFAKTNLEYSKKFARNQPAAKNPHGIGACVLCFTKITAKLIEKHLILHCPTIRRHRAEMFVSMSSAIRRARHPLIMERAGLWWKFYRNNAKTIQLTRVNPITKKLEVKRDTMTWFDLPKLVRARLSRTLLTYFQKSLYERWQKMDEKDAYFNLQDFIKG